MVFPPPKCRAIRFVAGPRTELAKLPVIIHQDSARPFRKAFQLIQTRLGQYNRTLQTRRGVVTWQSSPCGGRINGFENTHVHTVLADSLVNREYNSMLAVVFSPRACYVCQGNSFCVYSQMARGNRPQNVVDRLNQAFYWNAPNSAAH